MTLKNNQRKSNRGGRRAGAGRPKGAPNKLTAAAKDAIAQAFEQLGGVDALVAWAEEDDDYRKVFYSQIWTKIIPLQLAGDKDNPLFPSRIELVAPQSGA